MDTLTQIKSDALHKDDLDADIDEKEENDTESIGCNRAEVDIDVNIKKYNNVKAIGQRRCVHW